MLSNFNKYYLKFSKKLDKFTQNEKIIDENFETFSKGFFGEYEIINMKLREFTVKCTSNNGELYVMSKFFFIKNFLHNSTGQHYIFLTVLEKNQKNLIEKFQAFKKSHKISENFNKNLNLNDNSLLFLNNSKSHSLGKIINEKNFLFAVYFMNFFTFKLEFLIMIN